MGKILRLGSLLAAGFLAASMSVTGASAFQEDEDDVKPAPARGDEGEGPFERLILRGATLIDGTGAPPAGPVDIVIEQNRIVEVKGVGTPGIPIDESKRPQNPTREIDASGSYVLPGFVDLHTHTGGVPKAPEAEYVYKLWMGHGVTTTRDAGSGASELVLSEKARSSRNEIVAPRIFAYARPGTGEDWDGGPIHTPEKAREWVRWAAQKGIDGLKLGAYDPEIMAALIDEAKASHLGTMAHLGQNGVARMDVLDAARLGLGTQTHFYGLFEALLKDHYVQDWPVGQNQSDEQHRFGQVGRLWSQIHPRGSEKWNALVEELVALRLTIDPTMTIYAAGRNVMAARNADWHEKYTLPSQWDFYQPNRQNHGAYWYNWTTHDEVAWRSFYRVWMDFLGDFKNAGGRVTTGSDSGFIYKLYGF
ncbi:MAG: amidohydrolase family protein, partial [Vicinamibacteria bacterium]